ncbi:MAG: DUF899 family protein [Acetobacteraceae bacterium]|nr:DUF899 family protein [Acetobacteraceae bacterium]
MNYRDSTAKLAGYRHQIEEIRHRMREVQASIEPEQVQDYTFATPDGSVRLSELFAGKRDLIVIHNMGASCPYCTLWADGFNGVYPHLADRASFVVSSPDAPDAQARFATSRGWRFPMVSHQGSSFAADMGYVGKEGGALPGVSVFRREADTILRVADTGFHPRDDFCLVWHLFDLLQDGAAGWNAQFSYI